MTKEALKLALEALNTTESDCGSRAWEREQEAITAIKEALANEALEKMAENARELGLDYEPEQPKVRTGNCLRVGVCASEGHKISPQRKPLTDKEIDVLWFKAKDKDNSIIKHFARAIEAKLRSKNESKN